MCFAPHDLHSTKVLLAYGVAGVHHPSIQGLDGSTLADQLVAILPCLPILVQASCPSSIVDLIESHLAPSPLVLLHPSFPSLPSAPSCLKHPPKPSYSKDWVWRVTEGMSVQFCRCAPSSRVLMTEPYPTALSMPFCFQQEWTHIVPQ